MGVIGLVFLLRVDERLHTLLESGVILLHVHDVEPILMALLNVVHRKEEPLGIVKRVVVKVQDQVVL